MELKDIMALATDKQIAELKNGNTNTIPDIEDLKKQWDPKLHEVMDTSIRMDKVVKRSKKNSDGTKMETSELEKVNRISIAFQRLIVDRAVGFLLGNPVTLKVKLDEKNKKQSSLHQMVKSTLIDNKSKYLDRKIASTVKSQCEVAELWFPLEDQAFWKNKLESQKNVKYKLRAQLLTRKDGNILYPYFDATGDMIAFSRQYTTTENGKAIVHFDTYTEFQTIKRTNQNGEWVVDQKPNIFKKIPVMYYYQPEPDWYVAQPLINRYEKKLSNYGDATDYFGSPMVKTKGKVLAMPEKSSTGKIIQLDENADANYMTWDQAPEAERLEFEILEKHIFGTTQTPNISFDQMKSIGGDMSGFAIKLLFTDAHIKAENDIALFGEIYQRRLNFLKHALGTVVNTALADEVDNVEIEPEFVPYLPKNVKEVIEYLATARGNKPLISSETAMENNPLVDDPARETERMKADEEAELEQQQKELTGTFNP